MPELAYGTKEIVDAKGCVVPGPGNSGKSHDSNGKKHSDWGAKRKSSLLRPQRSTGHTKTP